MADDAKGQDGVNVQVLLRCRPLSDKEIVDRAPPVVTCNDALREVTLFQNAGGKQLSRTFRFDRVFGPDSTQEKLYKQAISPIVTEVMDGFNCTIFAYGQTGTGKTYTMEGGPRDSTDGHNMSREAGVIPRSIRQIFDTIEAHNVDSTVKVSFLELYNEELTDLLAFDDDSKRLRLLEDRSGVVVQGLEEAVVRNAEDIYSLLDRGSAKRRTASTLLNNRSSRSHSIFTVTIHLKETTPEGEDVIKIGKLNLVDLAGSENISRSGAKDGRAREAGSINQSLLTLGRVITALVEHSGHVPYRDSKLTRLLRDSLGGRTKTCIIATIAPTVQCSEETVSTLDYAHRAKNIRNRPEVNQRISKTAMIKEMVTELEKLKMDLVATREKNGVYLAYETHNQNELERAQLKEQVKALRAEIEQNELEATQELEAAKAAHARQVASLQATLEAREQQLVATQQQLAEAQLAVKERAFIAAAHQRAEVALAGHAMQITTELATCAQDLDAVFERLDRVAALQGEDRTVMGGVRDFVHERLQQLQSSVSSVVSAQGQHSAAVRSDLTAFREQKERDIQQLQQQVAAVQTIVEQLQQLMTQRVATTAEAATSALSSAEAQSSTFVREVCDAAESAHSAASGAVGSLVAVLEAQTKHMQQFAHRQATAAEEALRGVRQLAESVQAQFKGVQDAAVSIQGSIKQRHTAAEESLGSFSADFEGLMQRQQEAFLKQVGALVTTIAEERSKALQDAVQQLRQQFAGDAQHMESSARQLESGAQQAIAAIGTSEQALVQRMQSAAAASTQDITSIGTALHKGGVDGAACQPMLVQQYGAQREKLEGHAKAMSALVDKGRAASASSSASAQQTLTEGTTALGSAHTTLLRSVSEQHAANVAMASSLEQLSMEAGDTLQAFGAQHQEQASDICDQVSKRVNTQLGLTVPGSAPHKRDVSVPSDMRIRELMCPPDEVLVVTFRKDVPRPPSRSGTLADLQREGSVIATITTSAMPAANGGSGMGSVPQSPASALVKQRSSKIPGFQASVGNGGSILAGYAPMDRDTPAARDV